MRSVFSRIQMLKHLRGKNNIINAMKDLKSVRSMRSCKLIKILALVITLISHTSCAVINDKLSYKDIINDFPTTTDFDHYLNALEKAVDFCIRHKRYVDLNMQFGLFLTDVNLREIFQQKQTSVPEKIRWRLESLFLKNDELSDFFHTMVQNYQNVTRIGQDIKLSLLFYNASTWSRPLDTFNKNLLKQTKIYSAKQLNKIYGNWQDYFNNVNEFDKNYPTPRQSNECLAHLVRTPHSRLNRNLQSNCLTPSQCKLIIQEGSEFGYALTHRLLFLVVTRFSRGCVVFSEKQDKSWTDSFCKKCFYEAEYIASNSFQVPDLIYEQIGVCGLFGHAQFIRNYWLKTLLEFQTSEGCFSGKIATGEYDELQMRENEEDMWKINRKWDIMNGQCNGHFSSVALATLSSALRYIMETYY